VAKSRNNLLGVGGQRTKLSRRGAAGETTSSAADRRSAADQKQELLRRMRERTAGSAEQETAGQEPGTASGAQD
jgi:Family of unknown function (DUF6243)